MKQLNYLVIGFKNNLYYKLLKTIQEQVCKEQYKSRNKKDSNILRISVQSLGSPVWMAKDCEDEEPGRNYGQDLIKFIFCLRTILRDTNAVAFVSIPSHLFDASIL